jgi:hypothetical protein
MKTNDNAIKKLSAISSSSGIQTIRRVRMITVQELLIKQVYDVNAIYVKKNIVPIAIS